MPSKRDRKTKKGGSSIEISPLKETVKRRRAAVDNKKLDNDESQKTTPSKTLKKITPSKRKTPSKATPSKATPSKATPSKRKTPSKVTTPKTPKATPKAKATPTKPKTKVARKKLKDLWKDDESDNFSLADTDASLAFLHVPSPEKRPKAAEVVTDVVGDLSAKQVRNVKFGFNDDEKEVLFNWLEVMELQQVTHKEYHLIPEELRVLLQKKASEYKHGKTTCKGVQLYNMFKTNRKCYTNYNTILNKSGQEAAHVLALKHTQLQKHIIAIYTKHASSSGCIPKTRPRNTMRSKVSISCFILNISATLFIQKFHQNVFFCR